MASKSSKYEINISVFIIAISLLYPILLPVGMALKKYSAIWGILKAGEVTSRNRIPAGGSCAYFFVFCFCTCVPIRSEGILLSSLAAAHVLLRSVSEIRL